MLKRILTVAAFATLLSGCANGLSPSSAGLTTNVQTPITAGQ